MEKQSESLKDRKRDGENNSRAEKEALKELNEYFEKVANEFNPLGYEGYPSEE